MEAKEIIRVFYEEVVTRNELERVGDYVSPTFESYYSIYAAIAQGERENMRDNVVTAINHKILASTSEIYSCPCYGYKKAEDGTFTIIQDEAENVKLIFSLYLEGKSIVDIIC